jgi:hypothetical protein
MPRFFTKKELSVLDAPTASPFTMESVGGNYGQVVEPAVDDQVFQESDEIERGVGPNMVNATMTLDHVNKPGRRRSSFRSTDGQDIEKSAH